MKTKLTVLMASAECRGIAKVGGLADVAFDLSARLRAEGHTVHVLVPSYSASSGSTSGVAEPVLDFLVRFEGESVATRLRKTSVEGLLVYLIEAAPLRAEDGGVYVDSGKKGKGPFEDDARRFAFFSAAVWELVKHGEPFQKTQVVHCHDWHTGLIPLLARLDGESGRYATLFTIHNLDYQGTRPFDDSYAPGASWRQWFPERWEALVQSGLMDSIADPVARHCFNPLRCGIRLADAVNTVSPSYALEITQADDPRSNFLGGRGLETDLARRRDEGRLWGILNGLDYEAFNPEKLTPSFHQASEDLLQARRVHRDQFLKALPSTLQTLVEKHGARFGNAARAQAHLPAFLNAAATLPLTVCVTRAVSQKLGLFTEDLEPGQPVSRAFLAQGTALLVLGTGELEAKLEPLNDEPSALFLQVFDAALATQLYSVGELFLMPSDFEPCGISQLMALRYGCLPLVHDRGGLHDTVRDAKTGFVFQGSDRDQAKRAFVQTTARAVKALQGPHYEALVRQAMAERFEWTGSVHEYEKIYRLVAPSLGSGRMTKG